MVTKQEFEAKLLKTCNKIAGMIVERSKKLNGGVSEISNEEAFKIATRIVFRTYGDILKNRKGGKYEN